MVFLNSTSISLYNYPLPTFALSLSGDSYLPDCFSVDCVIWLSGLKSGFGTVVVVPFVWRGKEQSVLVTYNSCHLSLFHTLSFIHLIKVCLSSVVL